jgi:hypothetical protein
MEKKIEKKKNSLALGSKVLNGGPTSLFPLPGSPLPSLSFFSFFPSLEFCLRLGPTLQGGLLPQQNGGDARGFRARACSYQNRSRNSWNTTCPGSAPYAQVIKLCRIPPLIPRLEPGETCCHHCCSVAELDRCVAVATPQCLGFGSTCFTKLRCSGPGLCQDGLHTRPHGIAQWSTCSDAGPPGAMDHSLGDISAYGESLIYFAVVRIVRRTFY